MEPFKTLVIFDLETTGLKHEEIYCPKITEMTLMACLTSHIQNEKLPRVVNKLTLALNPMRNIRPGATRVTGLHNEFLEELKPFDNGTVEILNNFLTRFPHPLCLIAHNGNNFDFPIFQKHLSKCSTKFVDNVFCADSLIAFRQILLPVSSLKNVQQSKDVVLPSNMMPSNTANKIRQFNETTPEKRTVPNDATPVKGSCNINQIPKSSKACRRLTYGETTADDMEKGTVERSLHVADTKLVSYKLKDIYAFVGGPPLEFHKSEDDCLALLTSIVKCKDDFLLWLSRNARPLDQIEPLC